MIVVNIEATIQAEAGIPEEVVKELTRRGHVVTRVKVNGGGYQGILIDPKTGVLHGLTVHNMAPAQIARAVMEGVTLGLTGPWPPYTFAAAGPERGA